MISKRIQSFIPTITAYFSDKPVVRAWLFGSCSRGEETPNSDIDLMVDYDKSQRVSLMSICGMIVELETLLGVPVDLVENGRIKDFAIHSVNSDKILIYERTNTR